MSLESGGRSESDRVVTLVEAFRNRILRWEYPPRYRLVEEELCREYNVSRSPLREALRTLYADGFLDWVPRRGYSVKQLDIRAARELYEVRLALEMYLVEQIARTGIDEQVSARLLAPWSPERCDTYRPGEELAELDRAFHEGLARETGNETLCSYLSDINDRIHVFRAINLGRKDMVEPTCAQHRDVIEAIRARDPQRARAAMRMNIELARGNVESTLKEALARAFFRDGGRA